MNKFMMNAAVIAAIPSRVILVAVTKTLPASSIQEAYRAGIRHFGENYVEEFEQKYANLPRKIKENAVFHMIGHVQSRKVKRVAELFDWVDSVDSIELARKLDGAAGKLHKKLHVLFQVNVSGEETKYGFQNSHIVISGLTRVSPVLYENFIFRNLILDGLMTMPPAVGNPEENRTIFRSLKNVSQTLRKKHPGFGPELSMGTSQDYRVAIAEGATMVRLGTILFGC